MSLIDTILGLFPGASSTKEDLVSLNDMRLRKYRSNWVAYYGFDLSKMQTEDGSAASRVNFLKRNIDKVNYFAFGGGFEMTHPRFQDYLRLAEISWGTHKIEKLLKMAQQGSVTGDAFIMVAPKSVATAIAKESTVVDAEELPTTAKVSIVVIPSEYCLPFYDAFDGDVLIAMEVKVPFQILGPDKKYVTMYQYMKITDKEISSGVLDGEGNVYGISANERSTALATQENPIKSVYCVHIRNFPAGNSIYGSDDVNEAAPLNRAYTERLTDIGAIVNYHSAPITCVYGAKAGSLVRGPNKVWGNLPKDGRVENLELRTDLKAAQDHLASIKQGIHELTGVPEIAQGSQQSISNTSGVALHTMYLPLIERADTKQSIYGPGLLEVIVITLRWLQTLGPLAYTDPVTGDSRTLAKIEKPAQWDDLRQNTTTVYPSPLPKDRLIEAQVQSTLIAAKLQSQRQAMVELGVRDPDTLIKEIAEDTAKAVKDAQALMVATTPKEPNATADATGSVAIDEGGAGVNSGAGATQGNQSTESGAPKGRPKE